MDLLVLVYHRSPPAEPFYRELEHDTEKIKILTVDTFDTALRAFKEVDAQAIVIITDEKALPSSWRIEELSEMRPLFLLAGIHRLHLFTVGELFDLLKMLVFAYPRKKKGENVSPIFAESLLFLEQNLYKSDLTLHKVASHIFMSRYHYSRLFKQNLGTGFKEYVIQKRMEKAQLLLMSGQPVTEVCYSVGYNDLTHFSRVFRRVVGTNPSMYRLSKAE